MAGKLKTGPILTLAAIGLGGFGLYYAYNHGMLGPASGGTSSVPQVAEVPVEDPNAVAEAVIPNAPVEIAPLPTQNVVAVQGPEIRFLGMAWNSQMGLAFANGGPKTTAGSLMEKHKVRLTFTREDDVGKMQAQLIAFAQAYKDANRKGNPTEGAHFMAVMGDGSAATAAGMQGELVKIGPDFRPEAIGSAGFSRGEDALWGPAEWKNNPKLMKGSLVAVYLRDGDWNIVCKYAADNGIKINPDEKTYDPTAINWYSTSDFVAAANAYIDNVCEERPVVIDGKRNGERKNVCVNAVSTWTPADVSIAKKKGGIVPIVSTREYRSQMPNTIIGVKAWMEDNRELVKRFLTAMYEAGDQVKANPAALTRAAQASALIYKEQDAAYWEKYFKGVVERDKTGVPVALGGSSVNNIQDVVRLYGILPGTANIFAATYTVFGDLVVQQYPKLVPSYPPVDQFLNTSYTREIYESQQAAGVEMVPAEAPVFIAKTEVTQVVSKRNWAINFDTGKATFTPGSLSQLDELKNGLLVADELGIVIEGHTDASGDPQKNLTLSQLRANAVRDWLMKQGASSFPRDRFIKVTGLGDTKPIATNDTESGKAQNRRVVVILGT